MRRYCPALILLLSATGALAQNQSQSQGQAAVAPLADGQAVAPVALTDVIPENRVPPLATSRETGRILSKNELYNLGRVADGRLGVRRGDDMSYRITGN